MITVIITNSPTRVATLVERVTVAKAFAWVSLVTIFLLIFILINIMLNRLIIRRVREMAHISDEISTGHADVPAFSDKGKDEISDLNKSFNRMRRSLEKAMKMLED